VSPTAADLVHAVDIDMDRCAGRFRCCALLGTSAHHFLTCTPSPLDSRLGCQHESNNRIVCVLPELPYH
jgi:hypothetical protein